MDEETWLTPERALAMGFATAIAEAEETAPSQSARQLLMQHIMGKPAVDADAIAAAVLDGLKAESEKPMEEPKENKLAKMLAALGAPGKGTR